MNMKSRTIALALAFTVPASSSLVASPLLNGMRIQATNVFASALQRGAVVAATVQPSVVSQAGEAVQTMAHVVDAKASDILKFDMSKMLEQGLEHGKAALEMAAAKADSLVKAAQANPRAVLVAGVAAAGVIVLAGGYKAFKNKRRAQLKSALMNALEATPGNSHDVEEIATALSDAIRAQGYTVGIPQYRASLHAAGLLPCQGFDVTTTDLANSIVQ